MAGSPLCTILRNQFLADGPSNLAPIYTNFEGGARAEKTQFFGLFFKNLPAAQKILSN